MKYLCYVSYFLQFVYIVLILNDAAIIFLFWSNFSLLLQIAAELEFLKSHAIFVFFCDFSFANESNPLHIFHKFRLDESVAYVRKICIST